MVDPEIERQIEAGLKLAERTQRALARDLGVCRGTVAAIALGHRPADLSRRAAARRISQYAPPGIVAHCRQCGRQIVQPCRACRDEAALGKGEGGRRKAEGGRREAPLTLALRDEDDQRYLRLRHEKEAEFPGQVVEAAEARAEEHDSDDLPTLEELAEIEGRMRKAE